MNEEGAGDEAKNGHSYDKSKEYWEKIEPTVNGMLGGFSRISNKDSESSIRFLSSFFELRNSNFNSNQPARSRSTSPEDVELIDGRVLANGGRALDCGAGIGRVTKNVLLKFFDKVDLLEQSQSFLDKAKDHIGSELFDKHVGHVFCSGLQNFEPPPEIKYDLVCCQWVTGYLTDDDFVVFLRKCQTLLNKPNGILFVKDNHTSSGEEDADMGDSSVTRPYWKLIELFKKAGLELVLERRQVKFPKGLYPVKMFALR